MKKDKRLEILRFQAVYLYDKGENDELFHVIVVATTDLQIYFSMYLKKSKEKFENIFFEFKSNIYVQKMLKVHILTLKIGIFVKNHIIRHKKQEKITPAI